jgi:two-component system chemotaxis response regulator CheY
MEEQTTAAASGRQGRILVVDDVAAVRRSIGLTLTSAGYEVIMAEDGEKAIKLLGESEWSPAVDAILCDLRMPQINGVEAISYFRREYPNVPVVVLTAYPDVELAVFVMRQGVLDFLVKPVLQDELLTVVKRAVAQNAMRKDPVAS